MNAKITVPAVAIVGTGVGITLGTFIGEVVTRLTGQTGWAKFGVKAIVKGLLVGVLLMVSGKLKSSAMMSFAIEMASYGIGGSVIPDAIDAMFVGGTAATAEAVAVSIRAMRRPVSVGTQEAGAKQEKAAEIAASVF